MRKIIPLIVFYLFFSVQLFANTFYVTTASDSINGSLKHLAGIAFSGDTIRFNTNIDSVNISNSSIPIDKNLTIIGGFAKTKISGFNTRLFVVMPGKTLNLISLILQNGDNNPWAALEGGAAIYNQGILYLNSCIVKKNIGINAYQTFGGAIHNSNGTITIISTLFSSNTANGSIYTQAGFGGAIYNNSGTINIIFSDFTANTAASKGGAIYNKKGTINVLYTNFTSNNAQFSADGAESIYGGAIYNTEKGKCNFSFCNFTNNISHSSVGGTYPMPNASSYGGAIYNDDLCSMNIINSSFKGNQSTASNFCCQSLSYGGAIYSLGNLSVKNSTFYQNRSETSCGSYTPYSIAFASGIYGDTVLLESCSFNKNSSYADWGYSTQISNGALDCDGRDTEALNCKPITNLKEKSELSNLH